MHDLASLKLGVAKDLVLRLTDQQSSQLQQVVFDLRTQTFQEILGFRFEFRAKRLPQRHGVLLTQRGVSFPGEGRF